MRVHLYREGNAMPSDRKFLIGTALAVIGALGGLAYGLTQQLQQPFWGILVGLGIAYGVYQAIAIASCYRYACEPKPFIVPLAVVGGRLGSVTGMANEASQVRMVIVWGFGEALAMGTWFIILGLVIDAFRARPSSPISAITFGMFAGIYLGVLDTARRLDRWRSAPFRLSPDPKLTDVINASKTIVAWSPLGILYYQIPRGCWCLVQRMRGSTNARAA